MRWCKELECVNAMFVELTWGEKTSFSLYTGVTTNNELVIDHKELFFVKFCLYVKCKSFLFLRDLHIFTYF